MASAGALRAIGSLLHVQPEALARLVLDPRQRTEVGGLLQGYAEYRLETKLKSPLVIQKLLKTGTPTPTTSARGGDRVRGNVGTRTRWVTASLFPLEVYLVKGVRVHVPVI